MRFAILVTVALAFAVSAGAQTGKQTGGFKCKGIGQCEGQQQGQQATGGSATSTSAGGAGGSATTGDSSANSTQGNQQSTTYQDQRQVAPAIVGPQFHTSPCVKGWGAAGQSGWAGLGISGGKVDRGCDIRETAEQFRNAGSMVAFCKMLIMEPNARKAGVTFEECMAVPQAKAAALPAMVMPAPTPEPPPERTVVVPAPQVTINLPPTPPIAQTPQAAPPRVKARHRKKSCHCTTGGEK
jgi:hypothetical protein